MREITEVVITKIENLTKIEALFGLLITAIAGAIWTKFQENVLIDFSMIIVMVIFVILLVVFQLLYYLKFIIEKYEWRKDQEYASNIKNKELELEVLKLGIKKDILVLEAG